ncbi:hypothetical protein ACKFKF_06285 [Phormidesmis sp. 146-12]
MLNIPISDQLLPLIEKQAAMAGFSTVSEYIQDLILREQQRIESLKIGDASDRATAELTDPIELMRLPLEERRKALEIQAAMMVQHYEQDEDWRTFTAGDIVEY